MGRLSLASWSAASLLAVVVAGRTAAGAEEMLKNGAFTEGADGVPAHWHSDAWSPPLSRFGWEVGPDGTGAISITSPQPNDARWCQTVAVEPGATYRISARVRTKEVGMAHFGAFLTIEPLRDYTPDLRATQDWQPLELVVRNQEETSWDVCGRLGSYSSLNTGAAWFTDFSMVLAAPPPPRPSRLTQALGVTFAALSGARWSTIALPLVAGLLLSYGLGIVGRR
jgi:hypothetical protein